VEALFPDGSRPETRTFPISSLCSHGITPSIITGFIKQLLTQHFCDTQNILNAAVRADMVDRGGYSASNPNSLLIEVLDRWLQGQSSESRPALLIKSHAWESVRVGLGNRSGSSDLTGEEFFYCQWKGSHTIFAFAGQPGEAQNLATEIAKVFMYYATVIEQELGLNRFVPVTIGEAASVKESKENYAVPVTVAYIVPDAWTLTPDAPRLKRIVFTPADVSQIIAAPV
jgi:hypothetical protein